MTTTGQTSMVQTSTWMEKRGGILQDIDCGSVSAEGFVKRLANNAVATMDDTAPQAPIQQGDTTVVARDDRY
ncbi:hypothetical protein DL762_009133 [Monosporascus cannonballus]|uniref:Uncharacterized protein n=1 Tax=Monosporascus cannonballus TaxID=155416 RepID=A0ABY0GV53_9PEZI|nr:hypothetical protein DL763_011011 [Monosporascus cannonballus]RYO77630.1 hypothetical protein DL762_009133 [Monosporascus cannonballus]